MNYALGARSRPTPSRKVTWIMEVMFHQKRRTSPCRLTCESETGTPLELPLKAFEAIVGRVYEATLLASDTASFLELVSGIEQTAPAADREDVSFSLRPPSSAAAPQ